MQAEVPEEIPEFLILLTLFGTPKGRTNDRHAGMVGVGVAYPSNTHGIQARNTTFTTFYFQQFNDFMQKQNVKSTNFENWRKRT